MGAVYSVCGIVLYDLRPCRRREIRREGIDRAVYLARHRARRVHRRPEELVQHYAQDLVVEHAHRASKQIPPHISHNLPEHRAVPNGAERALLVAPPAIKTVNRGVHEPGAEKERAVQCQLVVRKSLQEKNSRELQRCLRDARIGVHAHVLMRDDRGRVRRGHQRDGKVRH